MEQLADKWWKRVDGQPDRETMRSSNPKYVLRNWMAQLAIDAAEKEDYSVAEELYELLKKPYAEQPEHEEEWFQKRPEVGSPSCRMFDAFMLELMLTFFPAMPLCKLFAHEWTVAMWARIGRREDQDEWLEQPCNLDMQPTSRLLPNLLPALEQMLCILVYREERNDNELVETN